MAGQRWLGHPGWATLAGLGWVGLGWAGLLYLAITIIAVNTNITATIITSAAFLITIAQENYLDR